ncbi:hypothetical protein [Clostridium felsineum]|uniref:hypothetical protein n=1 Tax=Clostridium felsineum TaxID=36839 RepID=UPI00098C3A15|nr:hypothetical protein [Clostridium felsineum]URZ17699.1 hypothetical protein CLFE_037540 [Clostridium felsineum DSM 794]
MKEILKKYNLPIVFVLTYIFGCILSMLIKNTSLELISLYSEMFFLVVVFIYGMIYNFFMYAKLNFGGSLIYTICSAVIYFFSMVILLIFMIPIEGVINDAYDNFGFLLVYFGTSFTLAIFLVYIIPLVLSSIYKKVMYVAKNEDREK